MNWETFSEYYMENLGGKLETLAIPMLDSTKRFIYFTVETILSRFQDSEVPLDYAMKVLMIVEFILFENHDVFNRKTPHSDKTRECLNKTIQAGFECFKELMENLPGGRPDMSEEEQNAVNVLMNKVLSSVSGLPTQSSLSESSDDVQRELNRLVSDGPQDEDAIIMRVRKWQNDRKQRKSV